jgi:hypothetical protein
MQVAVAVVHLYKVLHKEQAEPVAVARAAKTAYLLWQEV